MRKKTEAEMLATWKPGTPAQLHKFVQAMNRTEPDDDEFVRTWPIDFPPNCAFPPHGKSAKYQRWLERACKSKRPYDVKYGWTREEDYQ